MREGYSMIRFIRTLVYIAVIVAVLLAIAAILFITLVDPNKYKNNISSWVKNNTGRELVINGKIERSVFPWLGLRVHDVRLGNTASFAARGDFVSVGEADIRVEIKPLFSKKIVVDKVELKKLDVNLITDKQGRTNWQDLTAKSNAVAAKPVPKTVQNSPAAVPMGIAIAGIDVSDANITWINEQTDQKIQLTNFDLKSKNVGTSGTFPLDTSFDLVSVKPDLTGHFSLSSTVTVDTNKSLYQFDKLRFIVTLKDENAPAQLTAKQVMLDLNQQTVAVSNAVLAMGDLNAKLALQGVNILSDPTFQGHVDVAPFNLKALLQKIGAKVITKDPLALQQVSGSADFQGTKTSLNLNPLHLVIDDSKVDGNVNVDNFATKALRFDLVTNQINLDRYMSPAATTSTTTTTTTVATVPAGQPVSSTPASVVAMGTSTQSSLNSLRSLNVKGSLKADAITIAQTLFKNVFAQLSVVNGVMQVAPLKAEVYQGSTQGQVIIDVRKAVPQITLSETLTGIQVSELTKSNRLTGAADLSIHLLTQGANKTVILQNLSGNMQFNIKNGSFAGANIPYEVNRIVALIKKQPVPTPPAANQTDFGTFNGTGTFTNGVFSNNDLLIQSPEFKITGRGTANLVTEVLNYHLTAGGMQTVTDAEGKTVTEQRQTQIPILVSGTFEKPIFGPDPEGVANLLLKEKVENLQEKIRTKAPILEERAGRFLNRLMER